MKKILFFSLLINLKLFGQSVELKPGSNGFVMIPTISTLSTCAAADKGKIVYYSGDNSLKICNGSAWVSAGSGITLPYIDSGNDVAQIYGLFRISELNGASGGSAIQGFSTNGSGIIGGSTNFRGVYGSSAYGVAGYFNSSNGYALITNSGRVGLGNTTPTAQLDVVRGTAPDGTAIFRGTTHVSHFNYATNEDTYIRGGKAGSNVYINDTPGLGKVGIGTINPQAKLHVSGGDVRIDALASSGRTQLYADAQGTIIGGSAVAFSVKNPNSLISIANATTTTFPFTTESYNLGGFFNNSTYEFNAPTSGIYHFDSFITLGIVNSTFSTSLFELNLQVDGITLFTSTKPLLVGGYSTLNLSHDIKLNAGQKIRVAAYQNSGNTINLVGTIYSNFSGHLVTRL